MSEARRTAAVQANVEHSWRPGWIWVVPIAALIVIAWLLVRHFANAGTDITILLPDAQGTKANNTHVVYRGVQVGTVTAVSLTANGDAVKVNVSIDDSATRYLTNGTRFWLRGAKPTLSDLSSLRAIISGPTLVMEPGPGGKARTFKGLLQRPIVPAYAGKPVVFLASFAGAGAGQVEQGSAIKLRGFTVGEVGSPGFRYDPQTGALETPVTLLLYPSLFHLSGGSEALEQTMARLVHDGLRARLAQSPPLIGNYHVSLEFEKGAPLASLSWSNGIATIPSAAGGGLDAVIAKAGTIPIDQIAQNVLDATRHIDAIVSSPKLADSLSQLDASLKSIRRTARQTGPKINRLVTSLRETADQLDQTAKSADRMVVGNASQNSVSESLQEITEAARAVRELADYLDAHPEALVQGRSGG